MTRVFNRASEKQKRRQLRHTMPKAEVLLWSKLKGKQVLGHKFRRQYSVDSYVLDFYCPAMKLAVELDGASHDHNVAEVRDEARQRYVESFGVRFLRFTNEQVYDSLEGVIRMIARTLEALHKGEPPPTPPW